MSVTTDVVQRLKVEGGPQASAAYRDLGKEAGNAAKAADAAGKGMVQNLKDATMQSKQLSMGFMKVSVGLSQLAGGNVHLMKTLEYMQNLHAAVMLFGGAGAMLKGLAGAWATVATAATASAVATTAATTATTANTAANTANATSLLAVAGARGLGSAGAAGGAAAATVNAGTTAAGGLGVGGSALLMIGSVLAPLAAILAKVAPEWSAKRLGWGPDEGPMKRLQAEGGILKQMTAQGARPPWEEEAAGKNLALRLPIMEQMKKLQEEQAKLADDQVARAMGLEGVEQALYTLDGERKRIAAEQVSLAQQLAEKGRLTLVEQESISKQLQEAAQRRIQLEQSILEKIREQGKVRLDALQQERKAQEDVVKREQDRLDKMREEFGLLDPLKRQGALQVAQKIAAGQGGNLSREELEFAKGQEIFKPALGQIGSQNAGPEFQRIVQLLGADQTLKQAEALKIEVDKKIQVELSITEQSVLEQIRTKIEPAITQALFNLGPQLDLRVKQQVVEELRKQLLELQANRRGAAG